MASTRLFSSIFIIFLFNSIKISSSNCSLNFTQFPYESQSECFDMAKALTIQSCCDSALQYIFRAMAIRSNQSNSIFLGPSEAQDCIVAFQNLHQRINLSRCQFQDLLSSPALNPCTDNIDSVINVLGIEKYASFRSTCQDLSGKNYSDDACFNCAVSFRDSQKILEEKTGDNPEGKQCGEALLLGLASSDVNSPNWVPGIFSCLWNEIRSPLHHRNPGKNSEGFLMDSKILLAIIILAAALVLAAPILYKLTKKQLRHSSQNDIDNLSVTVLRKKLEDESKSSFICSDLLIFSPEEIEKATNFFNPKNVIGEGSLGKVYMGVLPNGMKMAAKRFDEGNYKLQNMMAEIYGKAKVRHPNLVSALGYCERGDRYKCLVYEFCFGHDLSHWLSGNIRTPILSWEQRIQILIGIARGLCFLHTNPIEPIVHGDIKLSNILLNEKLEAKISDFITASFKPKDGRRSLGATRENDVFQFGIVLLQILTGRNSKSLVEEARDAKLKGGRGSISVMADPRLNGKYASNQFKNIFSIGVLCTNPQENERPNMDEVARMLEKSHQDRDKLNRSSESI